MIRLIRGSDESVQFEFFEDDDETVPYDLTDSTVTVTDSTLPSAPTPSLVDASNGVAKVVWTDTQTTAMRADFEYKFRLLFTFPGGVDFKTPDFLVVAA